MFPYQHTHTLWFWFMCITCISKRYISKAFFIRSNNKANVQKIKDSDKWIKNSFHSALWLWRWYLCALSLPLGHHEKDYATSQDLFVYANHHLIGHTHTSPSPPTSAEYIKQDEDVLKSNCSRQLNVHHMIWCTVLYSDAVSSEILPIYRQCRLMWKLIRLGRCFCISSRWDIIIIANMARILSILNFWIIAKGSLGARQEKKNQKVLLLTQP